MREPCPTCGEPLAGEVAYDWITERGYHAGCVENGPEFAPGEVSPIGDGEGQ